jgi:hypothetical protein
MWGGALVLAVSQREQALQDFDNRNVNKDVDISGTVREPSLHATKYIDILYAVCRSRAFSCRLCLPTSDPLCNASTLELLVRFYLCQSLSIVL